MEYLVELHTIVTVEADSPEDAEINAFELDFYKEITWEADVVGEA